MNNDLHDIRTQKIYRLMMQKFSQSDLNDLFFDFQIDIDGVPKPANLQAHVEYLMRYMFVRNEQTALTTRLKQLRPREIWEDTYTLPANIDKEQAIKFLNKAKSQKRRTPKGENVRRVEKELYEKMFKHTPMIVWSFLLFYLFGGAVSFLLYYTESQIWIDHSYLITGIIIVAILVFLFIIPNIIHSFLRGSTEYYDLSVNDRAKVRASLQKKAWGNIFTNAICFIFIQFMVGIDLRQINKRLKG